MDVYHQAGHNTIWNYESLRKDNAGWGIIFSPVNLKSEKLVAIDSEIKKRSFLDPQFYMPKDPKSKLSTYGFFPANLKDDFQTSDFEVAKTQINKLCIDFQLRNDFKYVVIPTRYFKVLPSDYYEQFSDYFINPFLDYYHSLMTDKRILLTVIVKQVQLMNDDSRYELLNWLTGIQGIDGIYLIFENNFLTKQIKNSEYLFNALTFIHALRSNELEVHIGYTNTEGVLYSIADPNSVSMGSYENLRQFDVNRFNSSVKGAPNPPNPRLYSRQLFQSIDYGYIGGIRKLYSQLDTLFEDSRYKPLMFKPEYNWHFTKPEPYKHYFLTFSTQISQLPSFVTEKIVFLKNSFRSALKIFGEIEAAGVNLDENSNGSHLNFWLTTISMYEKYLREKL